VAQAEAAQAEVVVEPWVLPAGAGAEVGAEPVAATDTATASEVGRQSCDGTPFGTFREHFRMELPHPSSSWFPCGRESHHL
jgi:hypothetical protein